MSKQILSYGLASFACGLFLLVSSQFRLQAADVKDSEQVSALLSEAKTQAFGLKEDAATMEALSRSSTSVDSHSTTITEIKEHVNAAGRQLTKLQNARASASPWQQTAIDRIAPLLKELASNTERIITFLSKNPKKLNTTEYRDYLEANADMSNQLASLIGDFVDYGKTKQRLERLADKLELPPPSL